MYQYQRKPQQNLVNFSSLKTISIAKSSAQTNLVDRIFETSNAFNQQLIVTFTKPNTNFPSSKLRSQSAPNALLERNDKFIVVSKLRAPGKSLSNNDFQLVVKYYLIPLEGEYIYWLDSEGTHAAPNHSSQ